jgi:hypothetical protein
MASLARSGLAKARQFLKQTSDQQDAYGRGDSVPFVANLEASIVWGRTVTLLLQKEFNSRPDWLEWYEPQRQRMAASALHRFMLDARNFVLKEGPLELSRTLTVSVESALLVILSERAEVKIIRGQPWYKRSPKILWEDAREAVVRPFRRWKSRREERRRIEAKRRAIQQAEADRASRTPPPHAVVHFAHEPFRDRAAVDVVGEYLDDMERLVAEAETRFGNDRTQE